MLPSLALLLPQMEAVADIVETLNPHTPTKELNILPSLPRHGAFPPVDVVESLHNEGRPVACCEVFLEDAIQFNAECWAVLGLHTEAEDLWTKLSVWDAAMTDIEI